jgi:hypothetical protein
MPRHVPASVTELSRVGLLAALPGELLLKLAGRMQREEIGPGAPVLAEGDAGDRFYVVLSGLLSVTQEGCGGSSSPATTSARSRLRWTCRERRASLR